MARPEPTPRLPETDDKSPSDARARGSSDAEAPRCLTDGGDPSDPSRERYNPSASERPFGPPEEEDTEASTEDPTRHPERQSGESADSPAASGDSDHTSGEAQGNPPDNPTGGDLPAEEATTPSDGGPPGPHQRTSDDPAGGVGDSSSEPGSAEPERAVQPAWYKLEYGQAVRNRPPIAVVDDALARSLLGIGGTALSGLVGIGLAIRLGLPPTGVFLGLVLFAFAVGTLGFVTRRLRRDMETLGSDYGISPDVPTPLPIWLTALCLVIGYLGLVLGAFGMMFGLQTPGLFLAAPGGIFAMLAVAVVRWYEVEHVAFSPAVTGGTRPAQRPHPSEDPPE
jgi:hypothetical protein